MAASRDETERAVDGSMPPADPAGENATRVPSAQSEPAPQPGDARLVAIDTMLRDGQWRKLCEQLGPIEQISQLPPALVLVYAVAKKEIAEEGDDTSLNLQAIRAMASLIGASAESYAALMLTKRMLRRSPLLWRKRPAPHAAVRMALVIVALTLGVVLGWMSGPGSVTLREVLDALK